MSVFGRTRVKICGVRDVETALVCAHAGADAMGVVLAPGSPRTVSIEQSRAICEALPPFVASVGLFVDAPMDDIVRAHEACGFGVVQLHGAESPGECRAVAERTGALVMHAIRFDSATIGASLEAYAGVCDALLVDGSSGGQGEAFEWQAMRAHMDGPVPIVLAGGLDPQNVGEAIGVLRPYGVDVSSGVESSRGVKDHALIRSFITEARRSDWNRPESG